MSLPLATLIISAVWIPGLLFLSGRLSRSTNLPTPSSTSKPPRIHLCIDNNGIQFSSYLDCNTAVPLRGPGAQIPEAVQTSQRKTTIPKVDCTGPDGKHFQTTQTECDTFNAAWGNKPQPIPQQPTYQQQPTVVSIPCTTSTGAYTAYGSSYDNASAECIKMQTYALQQQGKIDELKIRNTWNSYTPPTVQPYVPAQPPTYKANPLPTIGPSIPQYPPDCYTIDRSTTVICK